MNTQPRSKYDSLLQNKTFEDIVLNLAGAPTNIFPTEITAPKAVSVLRITKEGEYEERVGRDGKVIPGSRKYVSIEVGANLENEADLKSNTYEDAYGRKVLAPTFGKNQIATVFERTNPIAYQLIVENEEEIAAGNIVVELQEVSVETPDYFPFADNPELVLNKVDILVVRGEPINTAIRRKLNSLDWVSKRRVNPEDVDEVIKNEDQQRQQTKQPLKRTVAR